MSTKRSLELNKNDILKFLELYQNETLLYNKALKEFWCENKRIEAAKRISNVLNVNGFGPKEVLAKCRSLKKTYYGTLKKYALKRKLKEEVEKPKEDWFIKMNSFMLPFIQFKDVHLNRIIEEDYIKTELNLQTEIDTVLLDNILNDPIILDAIQNCKIPTTLNVTAETVNTLENTKSENTESENTKSENTESENTESENTKSENTDAMEKKNIIEEDCIETDKQKRIEQLLMEAILDDETYPHSSKNSETSSKGSIHGEELE